MLKSINASEIRVLESIQNETKGLEFVNTLNKLGDDPQKLV